MEGSYEIPIGALTLDGVVGTRVVKTDRTISGFERVEGSDVFSPIVAKRSDVDILPSAPARLKFPGSLQTRLTYSRSMRRHDFGSLKIRTARCRYSVGQSG